MLRCHLGDQNCPVLAQVQQLQHQVAALTEQNRTDNLSGLFNQRHLITTLEHEIERTARNELPTSLILIDIDHFKRVNDTYGHGVGDQAIQHIAQLIRSTVRKLDIPCRYGGEEFAVVLPGTPLLMAKHIAERLRAIIEANPLPLAQHPLMLTTSLGVDTLLPRHKDSPQSFLARTDQQLYAAKHAGRNCVKTAKHPLLNTQVNETERQALLQASPASQAENTPIHAQT